MDGGTTALGGMVVVAGVVVVGLGVGEGMALSLLLLLLSLSSSSSPQSTFAPQQGKYKQ